MTQPHNNTDPCDALEFCRRWRNDAGFRRQLLRRSADRFRLWDRQGGRPAPAPKRRRRKPSVSVPGGLLTTAQAAARLNVSIKTLNVHIANGDLKYVTLGRGSKRPRRYFTVDELDQFIANQTRKAPPCPSDVTRAPRSGNTTSKSEVVAFSDLQRRRRGAKPKK